tara:strand:- start:106 stop:312 length:207 start_codon:yes stop_codon:yes gene_type:complete
MVKGLEKRLDIIKFSDHYPINKQELNRISNLRKLRVKTRTRKPVKRYVLMFCKDKAYFDGEFAGNYEC